MAQCRGVPVYVVSSLCPVYFSSPATLRLPPTTLGHPVSTDPYRPGVSRPAKSRWYRHSGRTDSICRCCWCQVCFACFNVLSDHRQVFSQQAVIDDMWHCLVAAAVTHSFGSQTPFLSTRAAVAMSCPETVQ